MRTTFIATSVFALTAMACSPHVAGDGSDIDGGVDAGPIPDGPDLTPPDAVCGSQSANIGVTNLGDPPDILVVLDRSGTMLQNLSGSTTSRWQSIRTALNTTVGAHEDSIKFGVLDFPSDGNCGVDQMPEVPINLNSAANVSSYFTSVGNPSSVANTPAHLALQAAKVHYTSRPVNPAGRYVLLATDGLPNCKDGVANMNSKAETKDAVSALAADGIKTFVLGFDVASVPTAADLLNEVAVLGGVPRTGATKYYEANNAAQLQSALDAIAGGIVQPSCSFELQSIPPDPDNVTVTINGTAVPRSPSHANGWDYHPNAQTITFFGSYCTLIENGASSAVSFTYGCPGPVIN